MRDVLNWAIPFNSERSYASFGSCACRSPCYYDPCPSTHKRPGNFLTPTKWSKTRTGISNLKNKYEPPIIRNYNNSKQSRQHIHKNGTSSFRSCRLKFKHHDVNEWIQQNNEMNFNGLFRFRFRFLINVLSSKFHSLAKNHLSGSRSV